MTEKDRDPKGPDGKEPPQGPPPDPDSELLGSIAGRVVRMGLAVPAVFFLESVKPLSFIGSQALVFFEPFVKAFLDLKSYDRFAELMEDRSNVERLITMIEDQEADRARKEKEAKAARKAAKGERGGRWFRRKS
ncbi:MAG: hypothetical protein GF346_04330 [Candidatus Eisenbacteria bacterium]|nr:hypothetical protein [Candidatus Latescibacterota bacterium]MBD3301654.1 hypothetical protein [Candidatus Eisenbacteria bacterium]